MSFSFHFSFFVLVEEATKSTRILRNHDCLLFLERQDGQDRNLKRKQILRKTQN